MTGIKNEDRCTDCSGSGLIRNDNPNSDRIYGDYCSRCNGTGIAATKRHWLGVAIIVSAIATFGPLVWYFWP